MKKIITTVVIILLLYWLPLGHRPAWWTWRQLFLEGADFPITAGDEITLGVSTVWDCVAGPPLITSSPYTSVSIEVTNGGHHPRPHALYRCIIKLDANIPERLDTIKVRWPLNTCLEKSCREYEKTWTMLVTNRSFFHDLYMNLFFGEWRSWNVSRTFR